MEEGEGGGGEGRPVALGLGSNLGDRTGHLRDAVAEIGRFVEIRAVSAVWESDPVGYGDQPRFLNAVVVGETRLAPAALLRAAAGVEERAGRRRSFPNAPRTLDVDILLLGDVRVETPELTVPHPRWRERAFVLAPLSEVAPEWRDPLTGRTVEQVWRARREELPPVQRVAPAHVLWSEDA